MMHQKSMNRFKMCFSGLSVSDSELHSAVLFIPPVAQTSKYICIDLQDKL